MVGFKKPSCSNASYIGILNWERGGFCFAAYAKCIVDDYLYRAEFVKKKKKKKQEKKPISRQFSRRGRLASYFCQLSRVSNSLFRFSLNATLHSLIYRCYQSEKQPSYIPGIKGRVVLNLENLNRRFQHSSRMANKYRTFISNNIQLMYGVHPRGLRK